MIHTYKYIYIFINRFEYNSNLTRFSYWLLNDQWAIPAIYKWFILDPQSSLVISYMLHFDSWYWLLLLAPCNFPVGNLIGWMAIGGYKTARPQVLGIESLSATPHPNTLQNSAKIQALNFCKTVSNRQRYSLKVGTHETEFSSIVGRYFLASQSLILFGCVYLQGLYKIIGTLPFLVLYLKRPTRAAPIVGGLAVFFEY